MTRHFLCTLLTCTIVALFYLNLHAAAQNDKWIGASADSQNQLGRIAQSTGGLDSISSSELDGDSISRRQKPYLGRTHMSEMMQSNAHLGSIRAHAQSFALFQHNPTPETLFSVADKTEKSVPMESLIGSKKCSPDQIEKMIDARFTLDEIYSICTNYRSIESSASANVILRKVAKTFADCATYVDTGVQHTKWIWPTLNSEKLTFRTAFIRPHHLRIEHIASSQTGPSKRIVYSDGNTIKSKWNRQGTSIKQEKSLSKALTGTEWDGAVIPKLLIPLNVGSWSILQIKNVERMPDEMFDGKRHYRIRGYHPKGKADELILLWIDKGTYLISKIVKESTSDDHSAIETTIFNAHININLTAEKLDFEKGPRLTPADMTSKPTPGKPIVD